MRTIQGPMPSMASDEVKSEIKKMSREYIERLSPYIGKIVFYLGNGETGPFKTASLHSVDENYIYFGDGKTIYPLWQVEVAVD